MIHSESTCRLVPLRNNDFVALTLREALARSSGPSSSDRPLRAGATAAGSGHPVRALTGPGSPGRRPSEVATARATRVISVKTDQKHARTAGLRLARGRQGRSD